MDGYNEMAASATLILLAALLEAWVQLTSHVHVAAAVPPDICKLLYLRPRIDATCVCVLR